MTVNDQIIYYIRTIILFILDLWHYNFKSSRCEPLNSDLGVNREPLSISIRRLDTTTIATGFMLCTNHYVVLLRAQYLCTYLCIYVTYAVRCEPTVTCVGMYVCTYIFAWVLFHFDEWTYTSINK